MSDDVSMVDIDGELVPRRTQPALNEIRTLLRDWAHHNDTALVTLIQQILQHHGWWDDADHDAADARRATFNKEVKAEDRAYDGWSAEPQKRDLTARERDILTRLLGDLVRAFGSYRAADGLASLLDGGEARVWIDQREIETLQQMRFVLNPRHD